MHFGTEALARRAAERPVRTVLVWLAVVIAGAIVAGTLFKSATTNDQGFTRAPESKVAERLLEERLRGPEQITETLVVRSKDRTVDDPAFRAAVQDVFGRIAALGPDVVSGGFNYYIAPNEALVSGDRHATIAPIVMAGGVDDATANIQSVLDIVANADGRDGFDVMVAGQASISSDIRKIADRDLRFGETVGAAAAMVILLIVFRAAGAAWIPLAMAVGSIAIAVASAALIGQAYKLSFFVVNMITMIGLAVGIDYTLLIVARYREERARGLQKVEAIARAGSTASRAVFFSGMTVVLALAGITIVPTTIFFSLGLGAILVVIVSVAASLTLLPAVLSLLDGRINALRLPIIGRDRDGRGEGMRRGFWNRVAALVMAHPVPSIVITVGVLVAALIPYFDINKGVSGISTFPDDMRSKQAFLLMQKEFPNGLASLGAADIVIDGQIDSPGVQAGIERLQAALADDPVFGQAELRVNEAGDLGWLAAPITIDASSDEAVKAVRDLRAEIIPAANIPAAVYVGGETALNADFFDLVTRWTPLVFVFVLGLSFILLTAVFRSIVVPINAIIMNLLSVGAAYGLIVLVSQKGVGAGLLGFQQVDVVEAWLPLFLFAVLFGLSMDYHVFLLSRIRERYDQTLDNTDSVAFGLRSTARLIIGAAFIMVAVFGGFALGDLVMFQQLGFGLAVAVFLDATLIRSVLVPASMRLLGRWNWYLPAFLRWLPDLRVEPLRRTMRTDPQSAGDS